MAVTGPGIHGFDTQLYVLLLAHDVIVQVDPAGVMTKFTTLPEHAAAGTTPLAFDIKGKYGQGLLFAATRRRIGRISANGSISYLCTPEAAGPRRIRHAACGLVCDPYGAFEGRLFLADDADSIFEIDEHGRMQLVVRGRRKRVGHNPGRAMLISPGGAFGSFLYAADRIGRRILRIAPEHSCGEAVSVWRDLSDLDIEPSGLAISAAGPFGTDMMYVLDEPANRIVRFTADGTFIGTAIDGLPDRSSIELPQDGLFQHQMVIVSPQSISILHPLDAPPFDHRPGPFGDVDDDLDVDELDLALLLEDLDCNGPGCSGDLNGDGTTDFRDFDAFLRVIGVSLE